LLLAPLWDITNNGWRWRHVHDIANFGDGDVVFVIPHREQTTDSICPRVAAEDVLAMMNVIYFVTRAGLPVRFRIKDTTNLSDDDKKRNIVTVGGAEANEYTAWVLEKAGTHVRFEPDDTGKTFVLKRGASTTYASPLLLNAGECRSGLTERRCGNTMQTSESDESDGGDRNRSGGTKRYRYVGCCGLSPKALPRNSRAQAPGRQVSKRWRVYSYPFGYISKIRHSRHSDSRFRRY
jgi:hypothetical protein